MFNNLIQQLGAGKLAAIGIMALVLMAGIAFISTRVATAPLSPLYSNLSVEDSAEIVDKLEAGGIPYELRANGTQIMIPSDHVLRWRLSLAQEGLPSSGNIVGYELFDKSEPLGTSSFIHDINKQRALEGELARTITGFSQVAKARIHLVVPKRELFSKEGSETTASVVLQLKGTGALDAGELNAITHLVATAVPNLKPAKITIVDTKGQTLKLGAGDENDPGYIASTSDQYRVEFEKRMKGTIETLIEKTVGGGRVRAEVSALIDFDRIVTNSETYDPDGAVVRSIQTIEEKGNSSDAKKNSNVSVANNLPDGAGSGGDILRNNETERTDETRNFEVSKTVQNHVKETGTVKRLSVAVLVDGIYTPDPTSGTVQYTPRSDEELQKIKTLVASAIGFDQARGDSIEVVNMQFSKGYEGPEQEGPYDWLKRELGSILQTLIIGTVVVLVIILVIKPMVSRAFELTKAEAEEAALADAFSGVDPMAELMEEGLQDEEESMIDIEKVSARVKSSTIRTINDIVENHPQETLTIIRNWLYEDEKA
ncbi:MAG: fliF [Rickettsiales bacterium]|jgi:flagellar M-ring protein FliF|nr:fliF [Rickettsiales bacterium]